MEDYVQPVDDEELEQFRRTWKEEVAKSRRQASPDRSRWSLDHHDRPSSMLPSTFVAQAAKEKAKSKAKAEEEEGGGSVMAGKGKGTASYSRNAGFVSAMKELSIEDPAAAVVKKVDGKGKEKAKPTTSETGPEPTSPPRARRSPPVPTDPASALEMYESAVHAEAQGNLSAALKKYRAAFKLDAHVDNLYRKALKDGKIGQKPAEGGDGKKDGKDDEYYRTMQTTHDYTEKENAETSLSLLLTKFRLGDLLLQNTEDPTIPSCPLDLLPNELLINILTHVALLDVAALGRISRTCKKMFVMAFGEEGVWRGVCGEYYRHMTYAEPEPQSPTPPSDEDGDVGPNVEIVQTPEERHRVREEAELAKYGGSYLQMFTLRPRIRLDGVYISTCNYTRPGVNDGAWNTPIHVVTYFRFLRFFGEGRVVSVLTTDEPREVVADLGVEKEDSEEVADVRGKRVRGREDTKKKPEPGVAWGTWALDPTSSGRLHIHLSGHGKYFFEMELQIKSTSRGRHNKLAWVRFESVSKETGERMEFGLRNDKPYFFSRVRRYGRGW
ncbi:hypothetical protein YB2330_006147 [Saitoella coloradoensis]